MAALTSPINWKTNRAQVLQLPASSISIKKGGLVGFRRSTGYCVAWDDTNLDVFVGLAMQTYSSYTGDILIDARPSVIKGDVDALGVAVATCTAVTDNGAQVYCTTDNLEDCTIASGNEPIGKVAKYISSGQAWVQLAPRGELLGATTALDGPIELTTGGLVDLNGIADALVLDADADTTISAPTDDQIDIEISGADDFTFTANTFTALSGSSIATNTLAETTAGNGIVIDGAKVRDGIFIGAQGAPTAETGAATITIADILTGIVTLTHTVGSDVALTLDTGSAMDTGMPTGMSTDQYIDWTIINLSAAAADTGTVTASSGHTVVGVMVVQSAHSSTGGLYGNAARFRSRRTATNTWITYRLA